MYIQKFSETANMLNVASPRYEVFFEDKNADKPTHSLTHYSPPFFCVCVFSQAMSNTAILMYQDQKHDTTEKLVLTERHFTFEMRRKSCCAGATCHQSKGVLLFGSTFKKILYIVSYNDF